MKLVIDIPEEDWLFLKESDGCRWSRTIIEGVIKGAPLPKGHGRLIDADMVCDELEGKSFSTSSDYHNAIDAVDDAPTIIEADGGDVE